ncbi:HalOD1 output domain-containing protein [Halorarius litoreus]|uniref:HalOD1 output domain-containing protein n=1 Tax=Halorarius litoreus TaxID=2962676 RepID=UPI0020CE96EF|nr:HalOD1 output domain-containing protein [Halorarius litoreus]
MGEVGGISGRVLSEVAQQDGTPEEELPPLYDAIDVDALESIFEHATRSPEATPKVQFTYAGYTITVHDRQTIQVE